MGRSPYLRSLAFASAVALLVGCDTRQRAAEHSVLERVRSDHTLRVGYIVFPPAIIKDPRSGRLSGHFIDTINEITVQAGWKVVYVETDWANFPAGLNSKRFDVSIAPTFATIPRALSVNFTHPLLYAGNSAIARKGDKRFANIDSLDRPGVKIAVTAGEAGHEYVRQHFKNAQIIVHSGGNETLTFSDVVAGRADVALGDAFFTAKFAESHPDQVEDLFARNPYNLTPVSWSVASGQYDLLSFLNTSVDALETQGKLLQYEKRYGAHWLHLAQSYRSD